MSAIGPKRTSLVAPHMSAFGGKADIHVSVQAALILAYSSAPTGLTSFALTLWGLRIVDKTASTEVVR